ncbi:ribonuclease P protein component [Actibacterium sp. XHP0104]|uniref:ribonuclease P protein component n=1 Tax=Actibacterium sp. XHP0104 TaxID=2984335 RepID=UPI0021E7FF8A|nr:ribonuclease P protein component [Actibacterium sp. XHP0104]MCV2882379.1 ribonuclease P protein component [Actibacterium sp. XHP0104]
MTPPEANVANPNPGAAETPPAVSSCLQVLTQRSDFLNAARARRQAVKGFVLQARKRAEGEAGTGIRVGFTCSKKVGNAVARNRAKRRLRALAREVLVHEGKPGWDYVLIGRAGATAERSYMDLQSDLRFALKKIHGAGQ